MLLVYWHPGTTYLLKEDGKKALVMSVKVVETEGDFKWRDREMIVDIKKISLLLRYAWKVKLFRAKQFTP